MGTFQWTKGKKGDYLVRGPRGHAGQTVTVTKKSGNFSSVTLVEEIWSDGVSVALYSVPEKKA